MEPTNAYQLRALGYRAILLANWRRSRTTNSELAKEARQAQDVLFQATTVFPFILFPDTISIDRVKVTITHRFFFATSQVTSIQIEDILNVGAAVGPLFGSIKIWSHVFRDRNIETKHLEVNYLTRSNALEAERILEGYIIARHKKIDTSDTSKKELLKLLRRLGEAKSGHR